jgi:hypothetical protein
VKKRSALRKNVYVWPNYVNEKRNNISVTLVV